MNTLDTIGRYPFVAAPFRCDFSRRLFVGCLANQLLNAADRHSQERGVGITKLNTIRKTWVLSRLALEMEEMPLAYTGFYIETWLDSVVRLFTNRHFAIVGDDNKVYGYGKSVWAMIDTETRQPVVLQDVGQGVFEQSVVPGRLCPIEPVSRVKMGADALLVRTIDTHYSDVDMNGHVNSVRYIEHVLDLWDLDWYRHHRLRRLDVAYVAESHGGDKLHFYKGQIGDREFMVRITKTDKTSSKEIETCRFRLLFG